MEFYEKPFFEIVEIYEDLEINRIIEIDRKIENLGILEFIGN